MLSSQITIKNAIPFSDHIDLEKTADNLTSELNQAILSHGKIAPETAKIKKIFAETYYELGKFYAEKQDYLKALKHYLSAYNLTNYMAAAELLYRAPVATTAAPFDAQLVTTTDSDTLLLTGLQYLAGLGVAQSDAQALGYFQLAAKQNHADAQFNLGRLYTQHRVTGVSDTDADAQAFRWYTRAAEQGHATSQHNLGCLYKQHRVAGVSDTDADAQEVSWTTRAAEQGQTDAQCNLGCLYAQLRVAGVSDTDADAQEVSWTTRAAEQGHARAQFNLGRLYAQHRVVGVSDTDADAQEVSWTTRAAEQGQTDAQCNLGCLYAQLRVAGVSDTDAQAFRWYTRAAEQGHATSQYNLGVLYMQHRVVGVSDTVADAQALRWYTCAAEQGHVSAQLNLGRLYEQHRVVGVSDTDADAQSFRWYTRAGEETKANAMKSKLVLAATNGDVSASYFLFSQHHYPNCGLETNETEARQWYNKHKLQHLILYCKELATYLANEANINEEEVNRRITFINEMNEYVKTPIFFTSTNKQVLRYTLLRVQAYLHLRSLEQTEALAVFKQIPEDQLEKEDFFHLAMCTIPPTISDQQGEGEAQANFYMETSAEKGFGLSRHFIRSQENYTSWVKEGPERLREKQCMLEYANIRFYKARTLQSPTQTKKPLIDDFDKLLMVIQAATWAFHQLKDRAKMSIFKVVDIEKIDELLLILEEKNYLGVIEWLSNKANSAELKTGIFSDCLKETFMIGPVDDRPFGSPNLDNLIKWVEYCAIEHDINYLPYVS